MNNQHASISVAIAAPCVVFALLLTTGCASIVCGTRQKVAVRSNPPGAMVYVDDEQKGTTSEEAPLTLSLKRSDPTFSLRLELDGYKPWHTQIDREFDWWYAGNCIFGGIIGLVIDAADGAMWKLDTKTISADLQPLKASPGPTPNPEPEPEPEPEPDPKLEPEPNPGPTPPPDVETARQRKQFVEWHKAGLLTDEQYEKALGHLEGEGKD